MHTLRILGRHIRWGFALFAAAAFGCGGPAEEISEQRGKSSDNFRVIETAYRTSLDKTRRVPKNREELAKHLPPGTDAERLFASPRDHKPFVIVWGTDLRTLMTSPRPVIYGYEADGADGNRFVLTTMGVMELTDEDFAAATFPEGHVPPQSPE